MGGVSPETCWASYKYEIKFRYTVASCWIFLCEFTLKFVFGILQLFLITVSCPEYNSVLIKSLTFNKLQKSCSCYLRTNERTNSLLPAYVYRPPQRAVGCHQWHRIHARDNEVSEAPDLLSSSTRSRGNVFLLQVRFRLSVCQSSLRWPSYVR